MLNLEDITDFSLTEINFILKIIADYRKPPLTKP